MVFFSNNSAYRSSSKITSSVALFLLSCSIFFTQISRAQTAGSPINASVEIYKGKPTILFNGNPQTPVIYALTDVPGGRWPWEELPKHTIQTFCEQNIHLIQVDLFFDHVWMPDGSINTDTAQKLLRGVMDACPQAEIFIRFHVNPPKWWQEKHPEENTVYADAQPKQYHTSGLHRIIQDDEKTPERFSLASAKWIEEASIHLKTFLHALQALPEANSIVGIQVASGVYGEWHYWGFLDNEPDMSEPMLHYFRRYLENKYSTKEALQKAWREPLVNFENATLPDMEERTTTKAGIFRDPVLERKIIDYYEAQHRCVADDIILFCRIVKESWSRPIITGSFYGYFYSVFGREAAGGHLELLRVLNSPYIDFLSGPHAYYPEGGAETGDPYRSRSLINSVFLHGKLWLDEMDVRPPLVLLSDTGFATNLKKSIANTRRNMLFSYSKGMGLWFYDFGPSGMDVGTRTKDHGNWGWWDEPSLMKDIGKLKALMDSKISEPYTNDADVLLVHDTRSFYYAASSRNGSFMGHWANNWLPVAIFKSGAVHDVIHIDDLDKVNLDQYKAIVFVNTWVMTEVQKKIIREKVAKKNRNLIFIYAPGYSDGVTINTHFVSAITGMDIQSTKLPAVAEVTINKNILNNYTYTVMNKPVVPLFFIADKATEALGYYRDTSLVAFARKIFPDYTSWYMVLPSAEPALWRYIFKRTGATIYDEDGDIFYAGHGILSVHTVKGGDKNITLKNGKKIRLVLPALSTTLLDPATGEIIMQ